MKTKRISYIVALGLSLLLLSCENVIEFPGNITKPLLVVNSFITPDSLIKVHVSKSKFFLVNTNATNYEVVNNATVNVWVNDKKIEKMASIGEGYYQATFKPKVGDIVKVTAENADFSEVSTFTETVKTNPILAADTANHVFEETPMINGSSTNGGPLIIDTIGITKTESFDLKIKFKDPGGIANFYKINLKIKNFYDNDSTAFDYVNINSNDLVFGNNNNMGPLEVANYSYDHEFSDELFNGKEYDLKLTFSTNTTIYNAGHYDIYKTKSPIKRELYIELQSISESYFKYIRSCSASSNTIEFFSEPVQIYSNVKGGIGIMGSYSSSYYKIQLK